MELVAAYLKYAGNEDKAGYTSELLEYGEGLIDMAENIFRDVTLDERAWVEKRSRELAEHTRATEICQAREEGLEQGRTEGEASGRAAEKIEMARTMKADNEPLEKIAKYTGLSIEDIDRL